MPLPKPTETETEKEFVDRFMKNEMAMAEYTEKDRRYAVAKDIWERAKQDCNEAVIETETRITLASITGSAWEVVLIQPGISLGDPSYNWTPKFLEENVKMFEGVSINAYELPNEWYTHLPDHLTNAKNYLVKQNLGVVTKAWFDRKEGVKGLIRFYDKDNTAVRRIINSPDSLGLSIDSRIRGIQEISNGKKIIRPTQLLELSSVDIVTRPAAGGKFNRAVAGQNKKPEENKMKDKMIKFIRENRPDLLAEFEDTAKMADDEVLKLYKTAIEPDQTRKEPDKEENRAVMSEDEVLKKIEEIATQYEQRAVCGRMLAKALSDSNLPEAAKKRLEEQFEGVVFEKTSLDDAIKAEREYLSSMNVPGFDIPDQSRKDVGPGTLEKIQMALDLAFGLSPEQSIRSRQDDFVDGNEIRTAQSVEDYKGVKPISGIRELYTLLTGDNEVNGRFYRDSLPGDLRARQDLTSGTFTYVLGNTMYRRLVSDYNEPNYQENLLISIRKPVADFRQQEAVMIGYFDNLSTVDPETADYAEIASVSDEESTYSVVQRGNILSVSRKTIINDDMSVIQRLVGRLGRAARRTHAEYVWNFFVSNGTASDGVAWFHAGSHSNLGSTALSFAEALTAYKALAKMTEKDSGKRIGLLDDPGVKPTLIYPIDLMETGESIVNDDDYYTSNDLTTKTRNPLKGKIKGAQISTLTDANDWGMIMPPNVIDVVEMGYLKGRQEPEMFTADSPQSEQVFVADKVRYKIRHEYAGAVIDYRSGYKAVVA